MPHSARPTPLRHSLLAVLLCAALLAPAQAQITAEGQTFPATTTDVGNTTLRLNGVGLRAVAWLKGYAAGLYLPSRSGAASEVLAMKGPKRLQIRMLESVGSEEFTKAFQRGVKRNSTSEQMEQLATRVASFSQTVNDVRKLNKGDRIDLDFTPETGLVLRVNGAAKGAPVPGEDFYAALLRVFLGDKPTDPELKAGLLGGPVS